MNNKLQFFGLQEGSQEFNDIVDTATHYIGGHDTMLKTVRSAISAGKSRTYRSDCLTLCLALAQSACDLDMPHVAVRIMQSFMTAFASSKDFFSAEEIAEIEGMMLTAMLAAYPELEKDGITTEAIQNHKNHVINGTAIDGDKNL